MSSRHRLVPRDFEVLRTLVRIPLVQTSVFFELFFSDSRECTRRLGVLRDVFGYITTSDRDFPAKFPVRGGKYWRLTEAGLQAAERRFPQHPIASNHVRRARRAKLKNTDHRNAVTDVYSDLIADPEKNIVATSDCASSFAWHSEHDVILPFTVVDGARYVKRSVTPDATIRIRDAVYFLEVDRSTETGAYCRQTLLNYSRALKESSFQADFGDAKVHVLYITKSPARARNACFEAARRVCRKRNSYCIRV